jgi:hypothetical protein
MDRDAEPADIDRPRLARDEHHSTTRDRHHRRPPPCACRGS